MTRTTGLARTFAVAAALMALASSCTSRHATTSASTTTTLPTSTTTPPTTTSPTPTGNIVWVGPIGFSVPSSWHPDTRGFGHACLEPPASRPELMGCSGLDVWYGWDSYLPGEEMASFDPKRPGWYHATDVQPCPVKPKDGPDGLNGVREDKLLVRDIKPLGVKRADYFAWSAHCDNGYQLHPQAWYLPVTKVVVFDYMHFADSAAVLKTAHYDPGRWLFGFIDGVTSSGSGNVVHVDEAQWLSGPAALDYAHKHGQQEVPNDYLIVDDDTSTRAVPLLPTASIIGNIEMGQTEPDKPRSLTLLQFLVFERDRKHWGTALHIHLDAEGRVDQIQEQFRP